MSNLWYQLTWGLLDKIATRVDSFCYYREQSHYGIIKSAYLAIKKEAPYK